MRLIPVDDPGDPRIAEYRDVRDADLLGRHGVFIAEGRLVVGVLLSEASRFRPRSLLVTPAALQSLTGELSGGRHPELPVYLVEQRVLSEAAGFNIHRGCLGLAERAPAHDPGPILRLPPGEPGLVVVLEGLLNHDNVGGIFRSAGALGARGVLLTPDTVDPLYRKSVRVSMGGALRVPFARIPSIASVAHGMRAEGWTIIALTTRPSAIDPDSAAARLGHPRRVALLVGAEGPGLGAAATEAGDLRVRIPMVGGIDSLNAVVAASIAMHRLGPAPAGGR